MRSGRNNLEIERRGGAAVRSCPGRSSGGGRSCHHSQQNRGSGRWRERDAPPPRQLPTRVNRPRVQVNRPSPLHGWGYGPPPAPQQRQPGAERAIGRAGGAWGPSPPPLVQPHAPQPGNHLVQVPRTRSKSWRALCFPFPVPFLFEWRPRLFISFSLGV